MPRTAILTRTNTSFVNGTNFQYLCTAPGLLKLMQLLLGAICVGILSDYLGRRSSYNSYDEYLNKNYYNSFAEKFMLAVAVACLVGTTTLLTACVASLSTASTISKTVYEVIMHSFAYVLYMVAVVIYFGKDEHGKKFYPYIVYVTTSIIGTVNSILYLLSATLATHRRFV